MSYGNHSSLERGNGVVKRFAHSRLAGMPFALTEWDYCFPNDWRAEGGPVMAAYASFQDWNLSARFAYWSQTWEDRKKWYSPERGIGSIWRFHNDPAVFGQWPLTALMFLRGDVARGERVIDVGFSETDRFWRERARFPPDRLDFLGDAAFQHRIRLAFFDERYRGDADLAVASGRSSSGDYRSAAAAIAGSGNPVSDLYGLSRDGFRVPRNRGAVISPEAVRQGRGWFERALRENPRIRGELFPSLDRDDGWSVSDTGEIRYHGGDGIFVVDTPRTQGIAGFVGDRTPTTGNLTLEVGNEFATVFFSSLDGAPLNESNRILVTAVGRVQNADFERKRTDRDSARPYEATGETLGNGPIHIQPIRFTAKLTRERSSPPLTAYALDGSGARIEELSLTRQDDAWTLETAPDGPVTIYYEWTTAETAESEGNP